jgi:hypothetical protein
VEPLKASTRPVATPASPREPPATMRGRAVQRRAERALSVGLLWGNVAGGRDAHRPEPEPQLTPLAPPTRQPHRCLLTRSRHPTGMKEIRRGVGVDREHRLNILRIDGAQQQAIGPHGCERGAQLIGRAHVSHATEAACRPRSRQLEPSRRPCARLLGFRSK